jgi:GxxExxY protein
MSQHDPVSKELDHLASQVVDAVYKVHSQLGPGLLESVYEICLCHELSKRDLPFQRQVSLPVSYEGIKLDAGLRLDILVDQQIIFELKAVEKMLPLFDAQMMTYLRLTGLRLGFLINFNVIFIKDGIKRIVR